MDAPFRIPDAMSIDDRLALLERLSAEGARSPLIRQLAWRCQAGVPVGLPANLRSRALATRALAVAQKVPYVFDPNEQDWFQTPVFTALHGGDCEDKSGLFVALCHVLELPAYLIWITQTGQPLNHVTSAVWIIDRWCWAESAVVGARLCENPYDAVARLHEQRFVVAGRKAA